MLRPAHRDDLAAVVSVYAAYDIAHRGFVDTAEDDVRGDWDAPGFDLAARTRVREEAGRVVGYAVATTTGDADTVALPGSGGDDELLAWVESLGEPLRHHLPTDDGEGTRRLVRRGWVADRTYWRMRVELDRPVPAPDWPDAVEVHDLDPERWARPVHALVQTAFADVGDGHVPRDIETWAATVLAPERFDPALCLVVEQDGEVVAASLAQPGEDFGYVRQLAVARAARGRGLGLALLRETFSPLRRAPRARRRAGRGRRQRHRRDPALRAGGHARL